jgi:7-cyano-7-deazaguanine synthase
LQEAPTPEWWPFRNQLLVTMAGAVALRVGGIDRIWIGSVAEDEVNRDGSGEFRSVMSRLMSLQEGGLQVEAPAAHLSGSELVALSGAPADLLGWTHSCFVSDVPCLKCRGCNKHLSILETLERRW